MNADCQDFKHNELTEKIIFTNMTCPHENGER